MRLVDPDLSSHDTFPREIDLRGTCLLGSDEDGGDRREVHVSLGFVPVGDSGPGYTPRETFGDHLVPDPSPR